MKEVYLIADSHKAPKGKPNHLILSVFMDGRKTAYYKIYDSRGGTRFNTYRFERGHLHEALKAFDWMSRNWSKELAERA